MRNPNLQTAKVLSYVGSIWAIVVGALYTLTIVGAVVGVPMIIGGALLLKYRTMDDHNFVTQRNNMLGWGIFFLIFSLVGGVLEIVAYVMAGSADSPNLDDPAANDASDVNVDFDTIEKASDLKDKGVLTPDEFEAVKNRSLHKHNQ